MLGILVTFLFLSLLELFMGPNASADIMVQQVQYPLPSQLATKDKGVLLAKRLLGLLL